ncbi:hypothetical protein AAG906_017990 [Vitis piasezkii]
MSRRSSDSQDTVVNEEINYPKVQNDLDDWKLPKVSKQEIYKKGTFKFFTDYTIKTSEMTVSLEQDDQVIRLLDKVSIDKHKRDGYNFIHFGMIQVAAKPLTRLGLNTAIVMCLRDNRHLEYRDSIIGAIRISDADILDSVVLHIKTHGFKIKPGNSPVSIITRFAYKSMNTSVGSGALCTSPKGETTYFHSDMLDKSDFIIPKKILWKDVDFPENWHFANAVPAIAQRSESIEQIVQYPDGGGELVFSKSFRHSNSPRVSVYEPSRASSSSIPVRTTREEEGSSSGNPKNIKPFYREENESTQETQQDESPVMSPTYSQMINTVSVYVENFEINKDLLRKDFYSEVNKQRNDWFFSTVPKEYPDYPFKRTKITVSNPYELSKEFQDKPQVNQALVDRINQKIKDNLVAPIVQPLKQINMVKGDISSEEEADELIKIPTFPDMQFEERNQYTQASYTSGTIYEWNIDGMTEYNILTKLQEMTMVNLRDGGIIISLLMIKIEVFLTKVMIKIREQYNGQIPYDKLTYGEIVSIVTAEGIKLCNDFKLKQQMKNEQKIYKNEFGSFCSQFGFNQKETKPPSKQQTSRKPSKDKFYHIFKKSVVKIEAKKTANPYNLNDILSRFDQQSPKEVSIKELHEEVKQHKNEIKELRQFISIGATDNCLQEGLVPIPLCEESSMSLFGADSKRFTTKVHEIMAPKKNTQASSSQKPQSSQANQSPSTHKMLWSQQVEEEEAQLLAKLHSSKPMHESSHMPNKMLTLYYDSSDHSKPVKATQYPATSGSQTFKQWDYIIITDESAAFPSLGRTFKTKWWDALKNDASVDAIKRYSSKPHTSLGRSMLAAAKTPQEFQRILDEGSSSFSQENSYADKHVSTQFKAAYQTSPQPKKGFLGISPCGGSWVLFWVFLDYPRIGSMLERALPVEPSLAVDRRAVQAGLNDGPVYFQCYPNFTVRISDADILDSVVLHIKTHGFKIKPGNSPVSIITRFAYKSMNTSVGSGILWKDVDFPENWHFANAVPAIAQRSESIEQIVQYPDGGGELVFSKSFRHSNSPRVSVYEPSRASSSSIPVRTTREEEGSSSGNPKNIKLTEKRIILNTLTINDLQEEIGQYRKDIESLRQPTSSEIPIPQDYINRVGFYHSSAALNCLQEGLVPTQFYEKTRQALFALNAHICNQGICIKQTFILVKDLKEKVLLGAPFLSSIFPMKQHEVELPYEPDFSEKNIPTKARPIQMNKDLLSYCEKEIQDLLDKKLIRKSKSPWSCSAFYVQKQAELERGTPRLVINFKPLNDVLRWIRYPIPNKKDLLQRLVKSKKDRYKTAFVVPFGHYEWNVMPFGLKNAPSEFQNIMNEIFNQFSDFIIVYIDDVLIYSDSAEQHWKHLNRFIETVKNNGLSLSATKISLFQTKVRFLGHHIHQGTFTPIQRSIEIHKIMAPKTEKQSLKKSSFYMKPHSVLSEKFKPMYYAKCRDLERRLEIANFPKKDISQAPFSPLEKGEKKPFTPLVDEKLSKDEQECIIFRMFHRRSEILSTLKPDIYHLICDKARSSAEEEQVFISAYLQDLHIYLSAIPGLSPLLHQQDNKQLCNCDRNFTISRVCINLQHYQPINLAFNREVLTLTPEKLLEYGLVYQLICSDPSQVSNFGRKINLSLTQGFNSEWISNGKVLPAQHYVNIHYQNRKPTLLFTPLLQNEICAEPILKQIKHWRARVISRDFEAYPKNMGYLIAADSRHQIFCSKKIDPIPFKSTIQDTQLLMDHRSDYIPLDQHVYALLTFKSTSSFFSV